MRRVLFAWGMLLAVLWMPLAAVAAGNCPGCMGRGRIPCGGCNAFPGMGICQKCKGNGSSYDTFAKRQLTCDRCHGTGKCGACGGQGAACMVCRGTGNAGGAAGGTAPGAAPAMSPAEVKAKVAQAVQTLQVLTGNWVGQGDENGQPTRTQARTDFALDGTFLRMDGVTQKADGTSEAYFNMVSYDLTSNAWVMLAFAPGKAVRLVGTGTQDNRGIDWKIPEQANFRASWRIDAAGAFETLVEVQDGSGQWKVVFRDRAVRG